MSSFDAVDVNKDGGIDRSEFEAAMKKAAGGSAVSGFSSARKVTSSVSVTSGGFATPSSVKSFSSTTTSEMASVKKHREMEQTELHSLNGRLEACIMRQREKDENEAELRREITNLKTYFESEIEALMKDHESAISTIRAKRDQYAEECKGLQVTNQRQEQQIAGLQSQNGEQQLQLADLQKQLEALRNQNSTLMIEIERLKSSLQSTHNALQQAETARDRMSADLTGMHQAASAGPSSEMLETRISQVQDELNLRMNELKDAQRLLRRERERNATALEEKVKEIRAEFNLKMLNMLREREGSLNDKMVELRIKMEQEYVLQFNEKSEELQRALERVAEYAQLTAEAEAKVHMIENDPERMVTADQTERIHALQKQVADLGKEHRLELKQLTQKHSRAYNDVVAERDGLKARCDQLEGQVDKKEDGEANLHNLTEDLKFWEAECKKLQAQLHTQKELHKTIAEQESLLRGQESLVITLREQLSQMNAALAQKDADYESLLGLKVALDMEIKSYSWLLENEESRLGITDSGKKRKTAGLSITETSGSSGSSSSMSSSSAVSSSSSVSSSFTISRSSLGSKSLSFEAVDANGDGIIDKDEFDAAMVAVKK